LKVRGPLLFEREYRLRTFMPLTWILIVLLGSLLGWLAAVILEARTARQVLGLVLLGLVGALLGAFIITPPFAGTLPTLGFSLPGLLLALLGSVILLVIAGLIVRGQRRRAGRPNGA
jgi:uncharacterized membrane protein YeaQ/YmgE (transglycosylase-associated protein family)